MHSQRRSDLLRGRFPWHQSAQFGLNTILSEQTENLGNVLLVGTLQIYWQ